MKSKFYYTFCILFLILINSNAFGQTNYQDVVYLKNGSIIRGMIIEQIPNKSLKIETADRNVFVFQMDEIEKITKEPSVKGSKESSNRTFFESRYQGVIDIGYGLGLGNFGIDFIKFNVINGYRLNPNLALGFGTGIRYYSDLESVFVPLYADFRVNFNNANVSPYFVLDLGYSLNASNDFNGTGLLFNPSIGTMFNTDKKIAFNLSIGYEMQKMKLMYFNYNPFGGFFSSYYGNQNREGLSINIGLTF